MIYRDSLSSYNFEFDRTHKSILGLELCMYGKDRWKTRLTQKYCDTSVCPVRPFFCGEHLTLTWLSTANPRRIAGSPHPRREYLRKLEIREGGGQSIIPTWLLTVQYKSWVAAWDLICFFRILGLISFHFTPTNNHSLYFLPITSTPPLVGSSEELRPVTRTNPLPVNKALKYMFTYKPNILLESKFKTFSTLISWKFDFKFQTLMTKRRQSHYSNIRTSNHIARQYRKWRK